MILTNVCEHERSFMVLLPRDAGPRKGYTHVRSFEWQHIILAPDQNMLCFDAMAYGNECVLVDLGFPWVQLVPGEMPPKRPWGLR